VARDQKKYEAQMAEVEKANAKLAEEAREDANRFQPGSIHMRDAAFVWELVEEEEEGPATAVNGKVAENGVAETNGTNGAHANGNGAVTRENGVNGIASVSAGDSSVATPSASSGAAPSSSSSSLDPSPLQRAESNPHVSRSGLHHLNVNVQPGQLVGVIGSIGAYKSSFLAACLGEMTQTSGSMLLSGRVAYASQQSWIFADTVRNNILFGRDWDAKRYMQTIRACQLVEDIKMLPAGDQTQIGEKGVNLSGGQRARLSCARAVYGDCDVYLFDDPLAALDAVVARKLYEAVMSSSGMLAGKTRILVTHQTHLLTQAHIILLDHGGVKSQGTFDELVAQGHLKEEQRHAQRDNDSAVEEAEKKKRRKDARKRREKEKEQQEAAEKRAREGTAADHTTAAAHQSTASAAVLPGQPRSDANAIMKVESSTVGALDPRILLKLANAGGGMAKALLVLFFVMLGQAVSIYSDKWLSQWSGKSADEQAEGINAWVYIGLVGGTIVLGVVRARSFFIFILHAASQLHSRMFHAVVYSPMRFFESNPIGRMLNRFAKDQSIVDELFPLTSFDFAQCFFMVVGSLIVIGLSAPFVLIMLVPIIPLFIYVRQSFMKTSRELKRLDAVTRSPVYALFSSTLSGLMIVRSFRTESAFLASFMRKMDENTRCFVLFQMTARWFGFRLDVIAASIVVCLGLVIAGTRDSISASNAGFALSYCLQLTSLFQWCVRQSAEVETMLTSVERIVEYTELKPEGTLINAEYRPPSGWPAQGQIEFRDYKMRYRAGLDLVLKGVDLVIQPGEKVGVCGRTGAGKSSLFQSILRLVEADSGGIWIDGMEIGRLGLSDLRSNLAIIPQYPVIFSGTLRYNLDPFDRCSDAQLWAALDAVQLKKMVASLKDGLLTEMAEFGSNFSVSLTAKCLSCAARCALLWVDVMSIIYTLYRRYDVESFNRLLFADQPNDALRHVVACFA
jgi:ABC-type multidrug transport system fused ATPase/permease subunit